MNATPVTHPPADHSAAPTPMHDPAHDIVVQQPTTPAQLFLLFHGYGAGPEDLAPIGEYLAQVYQEALVVSVAAPQPGPMGFGRQWFPIQGEEESTRAQRVASALPAVAASIHFWQHHSALAAAQTALIGFSQGAAMVMQASLAQPALAARCVAHAGRFATMPEALPTAVLHLIHGKSDDVVPYRHTIEAATHLKALGADFTADVIPFLTHTLSDESIAVMMRCLQQHVPKHLWAQAHTADQQAPTGADAPAAPGGQAGSNGSASGV